MRLFNKLFTASVATLLFTQVDAVPAVLPVTTTTTDDDANEPAPLVKTVTRLTKPLPLYPGEVTNSFHHIPMPKGPIAIYEFSADVVEKDADLNIVPVRLNDAYLHHHVVFSNHKSYSHMKHWWSPMKPADANRGVGFGAGTESRGTPQKFYHPYAFTTVNGEDELMANVHIINTRDMNLTDARHCLECPCSTVDVFSTNETLLTAVANRRKSWNICNSDLTKEDNTACSVDTYYGGLLCCESGEFCMDKFDFNLTTTLASASSPPTEKGPMSTYFLRYTLTYAEVTEVTKPLHLAACCDASGNETVSGNIEYDIPKLCDSDDSLDNEKCVHTLTTVQMLNGMTSSAFGTGKVRNGNDQGKDVDIVFMVGHLHRSGMEMTAHDNVTGELICKSTPTYGTGDELGNERGYITSMSACTFDPPLRMNTTHPILITSTYDARESHTGVMSLFYIAIAEVDGGGQEDADVPLGFWKGTVLLLLQRAGALAVVVCGFIVAFRYVANKRNGAYEMIPNEVSV
jgi:hypothetical protein